MLVGSHSFWEGIDVKGDALTLVIIDKLPFAPPDDPVLAKRLELLQQQYGNDTLCFVIGMDSLAYLTRWHRWREILTLCHLLVLARPGYSSADGDAPALLQQFGAASFAQLKRAGSGQILLLPNPPVDASATAIRGGQAPAALQISTVQAYIRQHGLYPR